MSDYSTWATSAPKPLSHLGLTRQETVRYSIARALWDDAHGIQENTFERECTREIWKNYERQGMLNHSYDGMLDRTAALIPAEIMASRAMATQPGSKGGYAISSEVTDFVDALRPRSVVLSAGAETVSNLVGNISPARATTTITATWAGTDGTSVSAADQTMGQLSATPHAIIAISDVSEQLLRQNSIGADRLIMAPNMRSLGTATDAAALVGTGGAQPVGLLRTPGVVANQDSATATLAKLLAFPSAAGTANGLFDGATFMANTAGAALLAGRQRFTSTDSPLWTGSLLDGQLAGFRAMSTENVPSANLFFGSFSELVICDWGLLQLSTDRSGTRFNQAQVGIRALWLCDVYVRTPASFLVSVNLS